ncbi:MULTISPECIES: ATP-grasp domain-containing protein [unclassified Streptomyces]|uniref:ATP-grasp domain-containing protein n=1 Tax=unclassified Streptomyces TaxID=2593676 RepID=UPI002E114B33|nr:ATP-grasp domain-containing protein [Streptomyces sp. NBC_01197]WSS47874.1 ATP-grasp domain-containing protein [Streptomyces sp. NBC_01180]
MPEHVMVIHRWTDRYADYAAYLDHAVHRVSYVTTERAARHLPYEQAAGVRLVDSTENVKQVRDAVGSLAGQTGPPTRIVALQETDLDLAADLRGEFGLPGQRSEDLEPLRDKLLMAQRLTAADVPVPATAAAPDHAAVESFAARHGWPVLVKPRRGTASAGIRRLDSAEALRAYASPRDTEMLVQPWLPDEVLHVDGVYSGDAGDAGGGGLGAWRASRYLSTCLEFTAGTALGSVEIDDPELLGRIGEITAATAGALFARPAVFHLELFESASGALTVLEIGARPGGAEVPFIWREVHGIDLMAVAVAQQTGIGDGTAPAFEGPAEVAGWLLVPPSVPMPCRVLSATGHRAPGAARGPYTEVRPHKGALLSEGGYENAGIRFRFHGRDSAGVTEAVRRTIRDASLECAPVDVRRPGLLAVVGCGNPPYRKYALSAVAARVSTALVQRTAIDWQRPYVDGRFRAADTSDAPATARAVAELLDGHDGPGAVLTWDETLLETTAEVARLLRLPHMSPEAARRCRDKLATRRLLGAAGVPSAAYRHVHSHAEALEAADALGWPVVVKPRGLAGSIGVSLVDGPARLARAFEQARTSSFPGISALDGAIVEEYLEGPEISVDCAVSDGVVRVVNVARKQLGFAPYFEETGHRVVPWRDEPWADEMRSVVARAHTVLGVRTGLTHTELRLTRTGPRVVEVNGRLGGDFIPLLGTLATGVDPVTAAVDIALGRTPDLTPSRDRCAEVRFVYPEYDATVDSLDLTDAAAEPGIVEAIPLVAPGSELLLPPRGIVPRIAALIAVGDSPDECADALGRAQRAVRHTLTRLP